MIYYPDYLSNELRGFNLGIFNPPLEMFATLLFCIYYLNFPQYLLLDKFSSGVQHNL